jgi:hypothetical protein
LPLGLRFFLKAGLGGPLLRTPLPEFSETGIHWRWGAYQVMVPKGLISIAEHSFTSYHICRIEASEAIRCPESVAKELDSLAASLTGGENRHRLSRLECRFGQQQGYILSASLDESEVDDDRHPQIAYSFVAVSDRYPRRG